MIPHNLDYLEVQQKLYSDNSKSYVARISYKLDKYQLFISYNKFNYCVTFDLYPLDDATIENTQIFQCCITDLEQALSSSFFNIMPKDYKQAVDIHNAATPPELNITPREIKIINETRTKLNGPKSTST